jgi:hypothetical protein
MNEESKEMPANVIAFEKVVPNAVGHFRLRFYSAVLCITDYLRRLNEFSSESPAPFPFLQGYERELSACIPDVIEAPQAPGWWREQVKLWEQRTTARLPLRALAESLALTSRMKK